MNKTIKIAFRNFRNKPVNYLINFLGLSISLVLVFILSVYCYSEFSADNHHVDGDRIYLLYNQTEVNTYGAITPGVLKENIDLNIPEVQYTLRIRDSWLPATFKTEERDPITTDLVYVDESFFQFFTYKCLAGNIETALKNPMSLVLVKSEAEKLFGTTQIVGETVMLNTKYPFTVTAVVEPYEKQSCLTIKAISSVSSAKNVAYDYSEGDYTNWGQRNFLTFVKLENISSTDQLGPKFTSLYTEDDQKNVKMALIPLHDVYLNQCGLVKLLGFLSYINKGDKAQLIVLLTVAGLILLISLINYINISSSQRVEVMKQIGMQKIFGANRFQIFSGIVVEGQIIFIGATIIAFSISIVLIPFIVDLISIKINVRNLLSPFFIFISFVSTMVIGLLVCMIPALKLSKACSVDLIKKLTSNKKKKFSLQKLNVAVQFTTAIILIAFTLFVFKQIKFGFSTIGYDEENRVAIKINDQLFEKSDILKEQILKLPEVTNASLTRFYPGKPGVNINGGVLKDVNGEKKKLEVNWMYADADFFDALNIKLFKGKLFENWNAAEGNKIVVNETFIREHGLSSNPVGASVHYSGKDHEIIGVVKDFHINAVNVPIIPLVLTNNQPGNKGSSFYMLLKLHTSDSGNLQETIKKIKNISKSISPDYPVELSFLDAALVNMYKSEVQFRQVFTLFAGSCIFISCLGIFALSLYGSRRRIKEIGIRKVNGAKVSEVMIMLNIDFVKWVLFAFVIATPIAYYAMNKWLENFAYKTALSWWIFPMSGILALLVALLTVSWQSWKTATRNPVEALRYE